MIEVVGAFINGRVSVSEWVNVFPDTPNAERPWYKLHSMRNPIHSFFQTSICGIFESRRDHQLVRHIGINFSKTNRATHLGFTNRLCICAQLWYTDFINYTRRNQYGEIHSL